MDEKQWLTTTDPHRLLRRLSYKARPYKHGWFGWLPGGSWFSDPYPGLNWQTDRKLRLFACCCCRYIWEHLCEERSRRAVEVAEQLADGTATSLESRKAAHTAEAAALAAIGWPLGPYQNPLALPYLVEDLIAEEWPFLLREGNVRAAAAWAAIMTLQQPDRVLDATHDVVAHSTYGSEWRQLMSFAADLLRDLVGNPFRLLHLDPSILAWHDSIVPKLAQATYDARILPAGTFEPDLLGVLADALEDCGCTAADLVTHLRGPGPHVRGCWAIDLLTDRE